MLKSYEDITDTGIIRSLSTKLSKVEADRITSMMRKHGEPESSALYDSKSMKFSFPGRGLKYFETKVPITLSYYDSTLSSSASYRNVFKEIHLNARKKITAERWRSIHDIELSGDDIMIFKERYLEKTPTNRSMPDSDKWEKIDSMESPYEGLQRYW